MRLIRWSRLPVRLSASLAQINHIDIFRGTLRIRAVPEPFGGHNLPHHHPYADEHPAEYSVKPLQ